MMRKTNDLRGLGQRPRNPTRALESGKEYDLLTALHQSAGDGRYTVFRCRCGERVIRASARKLWLIRRPDHRYLELVDGHWGWTSNAVSALQYPTEQQARAAMKAAEGCGVHWPGWHPFQAELRPLNLRTN